MNNTAVDRLAPSPAPAPSWLGQGTAIEQSRAVAEVQAAVIVAQQRPRNVTRASADMRSSCGQLGLAERAFYRYNRGGSQVSGPTIQLARELARCWGNIQYGTAELRRDDAGGYSEMQAYAWDLETNTRPAQIFIVPHKRDTKQGVVLLTDMRDIYENNTNNAARRVREQIFAVLPGWYVEEAKDLCSATLAAGDGTDLTERIANCLTWFAEFGVRPDQVEQKLGRPQQHWTAHDLGMLATVYRSIQRGEVTVDDEFAPRRVTGAEIRREQPAEPARPVEPPPAVDVQPVDQLVDDGDDWPPVADVPEAGA